MCASLAGVQNRLGSWQLARQEQSAMFQDLCPDPGRGQAHTGVGFYWLQRTAGKRNSLKVKMRGRREADKHGTEGGKVGRRDSCRTDQREKGWKERNELPWEQRENIRWVFTNALEEVVLSSQKHSKLMARPGQARVWASPSLGTLSKGRRGSRDRRATHLPATGASCPHCFSLGNPQGLPGAPGAEKGRGARFSVPPD